MDRGDRELQHDDRELQHDNRELRYDAITAMTTATAILNHALSPFTQTLIFLKIEKNQR